MDFTSVSAAVTSANTLINIAKTMFDVAKQKGFTEHISKFQDELITLQSKLLAAQQEQSELIQIKNKIEKKLIEYENWKNIKSQYELKELAPQVYVYSMKKDIKNTEPMHWLCCKCFDINHKKSILQYFDTVEGYRIHKCFECKNDIQIYTGENISPYEIPINNF